MTSTDQILTAAETAEYLGVSNNQLAKMRMDGKSPEFFKVGRAVRYRWSAIQTWIDQNTAKSTDDYYAA